MPKLMRGQLAHVLLTVQRPIQAEVLLTNLPAAELCHNLLM